MFSTLAPRAIPISVSFERALDLAARHGFDACDIRPERLVGRSAAAVEEQFERCRVSPGGWQLPFDYQAIGLRAFHSELRRLDPVARLAGEVGARCCYYWIEPASNDLPFLANEGMHVERVRAIADLLADHGCLLALEFIGPLTELEGWRYPFVHTMPQALALFAAIDRQNVGLLLDCWHWYTSLGTLEDLQQLTAADVVYVHVNDAPAGVAVEKQQDQVRRLAGVTGVIDLRGFLGTLDRIGYAGPVAVEPFDARLRALPVDDRVERVAQSLGAAFASAGVSDRCRPPARHLGTRAALPALDPSTHATD